VGGDIIGYHRDTNRWNIFFEFYETSPEEKSVVMGLSVEIKPRNNEQPESEECSYEGGDNGYTFDEITGVFTELKPLD
jgi:hypothetical protein